MNIIDAKRAVKYILGSDSKLVAYLEGVPGLGKSDLMRELSKELANEQKLPFYEGPENFNVDEFGLIDMRLNQLEPSDLTGIPIPSPASGEVVMTASPFIPKFGQGILFIDELRQSPTQNISLASQLLLDRTHVANRLHHLSLEFDLNPFVEYLHKTNAPEVGIAYAKWEQSVLQSFKADREINCTPRSYVAALELLESPIDIRYDLIASCIGDGPAATLLGFTDVWKELPNIKDIIRTPETCVLPTKNDAKFATVHMMSFRVTPANFGAMITYLERFNSSEYLTMLVTSALQKSPELGTTPEFDRFIDKNANTLA